MAGITVHGGVLPAPPGLVVQNRMRAEGLRDHARVARLATEVVLHETCSSSARAAVDIARHHGRGMHLLIGTDGTVYQYADLLDDVCLHADGHNEQSVGVGIVSPFYPRMCPKNSPWTRQISAPWADEGTYVVPSPDQLEALVHLLLWLTGPETGLAIPLRWAGLTGRDLLMGLAPNKDLGDGIYAHQYIGHVDGAWPALYAWMRIVGGLPAADAYETAVAHATDTTSPISLGHLLATPKTVRG